jgi:hypothetical protein
MEDLTRLAADGRPGACGEGGVVAAHEGDARVRRHCSGMWVQGLRPYVVINTDDKWCGGVLDVVTSKVLHLGLLTMLVCPRMFVYGRQRP